MNGCCCSGTRSWRPPPPSACALCLLFVPALHALIDLWGMWDPASRARARARALPAGLVSLDAGAGYRGRDLNLGDQLLTAIEKHGQSRCRRRC